MWGRLWVDESGAVLTAELILLLVITVIGVTVGLVALRDVMNAQFVDVGGAIAALDPGFSFAGVVYTPPSTLNDGLVSSSVNGSVFVANVAGQGTISDLAPAVVLAAVVPDGSKTLLP